MTGKLTAILAKGRKLHDQGKHRHAQEILNKLVYAEPQNREAKDLLADVFEQIGYRQESPSVRNSFLAAAYELRSGIPEGASPKTAGPDMIRALTTAQWLESLGISLDSAKAEGTEFKINLVTPDNGEKYLIELSNATLTNIEGFQVDDADLTITIDRSDPEQTMIGTVPLDEQIKAGKAKLVGDRSVYEQLKTMLVSFDPGFEMMPGTGAADLTPDQNPFEQRAIGRTDGG